MAALAPRDRPGVPLCGSDRRGAPSASQCVFARREDTIHGRTVNNRRGDFARQGRRRPAQRQAEPLGRARAVLESRRPRSLMPKRLWLPLALLLVVPVAPALHYLMSLAGLWIFVAGALAIGVLADRIRRATEHLATRVGSAIGGLLNVSFGSLAEIILAFFVLAAGHADVVRAQITGSIIGTSLLGLGLAVVVGSIGRSRQCFNRDKAGRLASLLILVVIALLLPAVFDYTSRHLTTQSEPARIDEHLSIGVSIVLLVLYVANLVCTLVTHRDMFASDDSRDEGDDAGWPIWMSLAVLVAATALVALEAHLVSGALEATSAALGLSSVFIGVIVLALVGTASDLRCHLVRAPGQDGAGAQHLHRLGDPGRARCRAAARPRLVADGPADDAGLRQPARPVRDRQRGLHRQRHFDRRRDDVVRRRVADRRLHPARDGVLLLGADRLIGTDAFTKGSS